MRKLLVEHRNHLICPLNENLMYGYKRCACGKALGFQQLLRKLHNELGHISFGNIS
jgi:hypothetical protein